MWNYHFRKIIQMKCLGLYTALFIWDPTTVLLVVRDKIPIKFKRAVLLKNHHTPNTIQHFYFSMHTSDEIMDFIKQKLFRQH